MPQVIHDFVQFSFVKVFVAGLGHWDHALIYFEVDRLSQMIDI